MQFNSEKEQDMSFRSTIAALFASLILPFAVHAQPIIVGGGGVGGGGMRIAAGFGGPGQRKQAQMNEIHDRLEVSDDEWDKISPKLDRYFDARNNVISGAGLSWSVQNGGAPVFKVSDAHIDTPVGKAMQDIRDALQDKDTPPEELTKRIDAFKEALDKAKAEVAAAQKDLKDALTPRQQAILATMGFIE
jgi:hypothetical protein